MCLRELTNQSSELGPQMSLNERAAPLAAAGAGGPEAGAMDATSVGQDARAGKDAGNEEDGGQL
jgi:hypothetical protein